MVPEPENGTAKVFIQWTTPLKHRSLLHKFYYTVFKLNCIIMQFYNNHFIPDAETCISHPQNTQGTALLPNAHLGAVIFKF